MIKWIIKTWRIGRMVPPGLVQRRFRSHRLLVLLLGLLALCVGLGGGLCRSAAGQALAPLQTEVSVFGVASPNGDVPFWLSANQYGTVDPTSANVGLRVGAHRPFTGRSGLDYALGAEVLGRASQDGTVTVHELYGRLQYGQVQLTAGRREQMVGRVDSSLSLGSTTWSRNAPPLPRISVSSDGYVAVPGTGRALALKGYLAHGWFEGDRFTRNALLHEKYLYLRIRPSGWPVTAHAGVVHHAMWGGTNPLRGPQVVSLRQWADVALGLNILTRSTQTPGETDQADANHVGMYDFGLDVDLGAVGGRIYRQFYIEDAPGLWFRNVWDGLWGVNLQWDESALVSGLLWEHLRMTRQGARRDLGEPRGIDSYYNHFKYRGGWTYQGQTLGIPLLTPASRTPGLQGDLPGIGNNIVVAHHLGIEGHLGAGLSYRMLGTYSRNYGAATKVCETPSCEDFTNRLPGRQDQWSFRVGLRGPLSERYNLRFHAAAALDTGEFYEERVGVRVGLTWRDFYRSQ